MSPIPELDVLVIGAGQAGLATRYHLGRTGLRYELLDGNPRVGDSWRQRFDSLMLFTPRSYSALPMLAVAGDPQGFHAKTRSSTTSSHISRTSPYRCASVQ